MVGDGKYAPRVERLVPKQVGDGRLRPLPLPPPTTRCIRLLYIRRGYVSQRHYCNGGVVIPMVELLCQW